jgi:hypothetical protein
LTRANQSVTFQPGTGHYVTVCAVCLAVVVFVQLQMGLLLTNLVCALVGAMVLVSKMRFGPVLFLICVAAAHLVRTDEQILFGMDGPGVHLRPMSLPDVALCAAVLGYVVGHYRLQGIWYDLLPPDSRQRAGRPRRSFPWFKKLCPALHEPRPAGAVNREEIAWLITTLPIWAIVAQLMWAVLPREDNNRLGLPSLNQMLLVLWLLIIGFWTVRTVLDLWKHSGHDPATAQLYLQDLLWRDTRGEQRRVNRWLAWSKLARDPRPGEKS